MSDEKRCLHCEQTKAEIKANQTICGIEGGYETIELVEEWPRHRWADWRDNELASCRVRPEAYDRHRRTPITHLPWIACEDTLSGHHIAEKDEPEWGARKGQCLDCGWKPEDSGSEEPKP
jgi:hypothetical protein